MTFFKILTINKIIAMGLIVNLSPIPAEKCRDNLKDSWLEYSNSEIRQIKQIM